MPPAGSLLSWLFTLKMELIHFSEISVHIRLHGAVSQKVATFIITAVRTSNPIYIDCSHLE
jgi:hypothetical protein